MQAKLFLVALLIQGATAAKILALMGVASYSHHLWNSKYLEALTKRGHEVTYFSTDRYDRPPKNISQILIENVYDTLHNFIDLSKISDWGSYRSTVFLHQWNEKESEIIMQSEGFKELRRIIKKEKFDLVIHDFACCWFLLGAVDAMERPPVVGITALSIPTLALTVLANPLTCSTKPHYLSPYTDNMNLFQRADNYFIHLWSIVVDWFYLGKQNDRSKILFGPNVRPLEQILSEFNIIMVNSNSAFDFPFPKVPGLIPVGGLHIPQEPKPLPKELQTFLDEAVDGVIYFSLGSNIKSSLLPEKKVQILVEAFRRLSPVRVLWKWESDSFVGKPANIRTGKWFPQSDILAHANVRLFFTHSGLLSTQEALYHGKPLVGMPFFLDQHVNSKKCAERRLGETLDSNSLTVENVVATLKKVLNDPEYTENARKASAIFRDESDHPLDRAVYWTEYAIRHKGAAHLRHAAKDFSWYQTWMLDVAVLTVSGVFLLLFIVYKLIARISSVVGGSRKSPKVKRS